MSSPQSPPPEPAQPDGAAPGDPLARPQLRVEVDALVASQVLSQAQAGRLLAAAAADWAAAQRTDTQRTGEPTGAGGSGVLGAAGDEQPGSPGVLDVLGYVGGALLLGALIFLGFELWSDVGPTGRKVLAVASAVIPAAGGLVLLAMRLRRALAYALLALACFATGFAFHTIVQDDSLVGTTAVIFAVSALAAGLTRAAPLLVPCWVGAMGFAGSLLVDREWLESIETGPLLLALAFALVGALFAGAGWLLARRTAWTLAGLSGWAASLALLARETGGPYLCLLVASLVAATLFVAFVRQPGGTPYAVVGCLIVLSTWPIALYRILDSAIGVAAGLIAAGGVLITVTVVLTRLRRKRSQTN